MDYKLARSQAVVGYHIWSVGQPEKPTEKLNTMFSKTLFSGFVLVGRRNSSIADRVRSWICGLFFSFGALRWKRPDFCGPCRARGLKQCASWQSPGRMFQRDSISSSFVKLPQTAIPQSAGMCREQESVVVGAEGGAGRPGVHQPGEHA